MKMCTLYIMLLYHTSFQLYTFKVHMCYRSYITLLHNLFTLQLVQILSTNRGIEQNRDGTIDYTLQCVCTILLTKTHIILNLMPFLNLIPLRAMIQGLILMVNLQCSNLQLHIVIAKPQESIWKSHITEIDFQGKIAAHSPYTIAHTHICSMVGRSIASTYVYTTLANWSYTYISAMVLPTVPYVRIKQSRKAVQFRVSTFHHQSSHKIKCLQNQLQNVQKCMWVPSS